MVIDVKSNKLMQSHLCPETSTLDMTSSLSQINSTFSGGAQHNGDISSEDDEFVDVYLQAGKAVVGGISADLHLARQYHSCEFGKFPEQFRQLFLDDHRPL